MTGITYTVNVDFKEAGHPAFTTHEVVFAAGFVDSEGLDSHGLITREPVSVQEPPSLSLVGAALLGLAAMRRNARSGSTRPTARVGVP
jgi:hypothetical protein